MKVVVIGNGISGITLARQLRKLDSKVEIVVISAETKYFFSRTALMYIYMGHMKAEHTQPYEAHFWDKNRIQLIHDRVTQVDFAAKKINLTNGNQHSYDKLVLATGSKPRIFPWPGVNSQGVQGLYSMQDLEAMEKHTKGIQEAVIVGAGLIGIEMAEMLLSRGIRVSILVQDEKIWGNVLTAHESKLIHQHLAEHHCNILFNKQLHEILADDEGRVKALVTKTGDIIPCEFLGITIGVTPNIDFLGNSGLTIDKGILVDKYLKTNIDDVYAIGDCAQHTIVPEGRAAVEQVWYTGRIMGETLAHTLCGKPSTYQPGPWFNSAKFFDIEYHTYGKVNAIPKEGEKHFFWNHASNKVFITIAYQSDSMMFLGINSFGLRLRHECFDKWIKQKISVGELLNHLPNAFFDPEFSANHMAAISTAFTAQTGIQIEVKRKKSLFFN